MNVWLWAAAAVFLCLIPCGIVVFRRSLGDRLVGLEMTATLTVLELLFLAEGFNRPSFFDLPLTLTLLGFGSSMVFARFVQRWLYEMSVHAIIIGCLLGVAVALCVLCAIGLVMARDAYQRLQFCTPITSVVVPLSAVAVWIADPDWQARIKATLIMATLLIMNAVVSHATARAIRIRDLGHWPMAEDENISRGK